MADDIDPMFEELYGIGGSSEGLIPWDIGAPQPVVQQLVAYGAVRGEVLIGHRSRLSRHPLCVTRLFDNRRRRLAFGDRACESQRRAGRGAG